MLSKNCILLGAQIGTGAAQHGCQLGPDTLRVLGLNKTLEDLGHNVIDRGNVIPRNVANIDHSFSAKNLTSAVAWTIALQEAAYDAISTQDFPIFLGGDHSMTLGTVPGLARYAMEQERPLFVLWIDAHTDYHSLDTTDSGNLHGTPVAYITGDGSFDGYFPELPDRVNPENLMIMGIRSVDKAERIRINDAGIVAHDMRQIDEYGVVALLQPFLDKVCAANGYLHVSFDVDGLDPSIAPAVGTTVPGGISFREAHLIMEMLHDSDLVTSLDLVELNPLLDESSRTAQLFIDLTASLMGRSVLG